MKMTKNKVFPWSSLPVVILVAVLANGLLYQRKLGFITSVVQSQCEAATIETVRIPEITQSGMLHDLLDACPGSPLTGNKDIVEDFIDSAKRVVANHLPEETLLKLRSVHNPSSPTVAVRLQNLPRDPVVPASVNGTITKETFIMEALLVALGELSGPELQIVGYSQETGYSHPFWHVGTPTNASNHALGRASSLMYHRDMARHHTPPDLLILGCLREGHDPNVNTTIIDNRDIVSQLDKNTLRVLQQPRFFIRTPQWLGGTGVSDTIPLIVGTDGVVMQVDHDDVQAVDGEAARALEKLKSAVQTAPAHHVHSQSGDVLAFNNLRTIHGRSEYEDIRFDGYDRMMMRAYFVQSPKGRML